jgi:two-component system nitrate/nitrite response regulator NarL
VTTRVADRLPFDREISILLVDDQRIFVDVLATHLEHAPGVSSVTPAYGLDEARVLARSKQPDVVLLDYHVRDEIATTAIADLRAAPSAPDVLMLSATEETEAVVDALECGASGWVVKGYGVEELLHATEEVLLGRMYLDPATVRPVVERLLQRATTATSLPSFLDGLTGRQMDVLRCLMAGMTRAEAARRLFITTNTVRTHAQALLKAAGEHSTLALVARARELGVTPIDDSSQSRRTSS